MKVSYCLLIGLLLVGVQGQGGGRSISMVGSGWDQSGVSTFGTGLGDRRADEFGDRGGRVGRPGARFESPDWMGQQGGWSRQQSARFDGTDGGATRVGSGFGGQGDISFGESVTGFGVTGPGSGFGGQGAGFGGQQGEMAGPWFGFGGQGVGFGERFDGMRGPISWFGGQGNGWNGPGVGVGRQGGGLGEPVTGFGESLRGDGWQNPRLQRECPAGPRAMCFMNPCQVNGCPGVPGARCLNDNPCEPCSYGFYVGGRRIPGQACRRRM